MAGADRTPGRIGWGILGTGLVAQQFAWDLGRTKDATLSAVASRTAERADAAARAMGASASCVGRDALLARADVDIVYIATPTHRHRDDCLAAIAAGKAVLCEKPLAMSGTEARQIAAAAAARGVFCLEGLWTHFLPAVDEAERRLSAGEIGAPHHLIASFGLPTRAPGDATPSVDGGALLDRGCYPISLALRLMGETPTRVQGDVIAGPGGLDLAASIILTFPQERRALLACSLVERLDNRLFVGGEAGWIGLEVLVCPTLLSVGRSPRPAPASPGLLNPRGPRERLRRAIRDSAVLGRLRRAAGEAARAVPCRGYGFTHEIEEVQACLKGGLTQSARHPLSRSVATLDIIDQLTGARAGEEQPRVQG